MAPQSKLSPTQEFFLSDAPRTLFPLKVNTFLVEHSASALQDYTYKHVITGKQDAHSFLPQQRVYATKPNYHLRRTVKLDPVAEYFLYDIAHRNRGIFRKSHTTRRQHFGYRIEGGKPIAGVDAYRDFQRAVAKAKSEHRHWMSFDVATYFNATYHHDIVNWFGAAGASTEDEQALGKFLRESNSGRSLDCLPQGIYPCKMIGNGFLVPIDTSNRIQCAQLLRFMDDFYLFDDNDNTLLDDFDQIQKLLGERGLSVNPKKTKLPGRDIEDPHESIDKIRLELLTKRDRIIETSIMDEDDNEPPTLTDEQSNYLLGLLSDDSLDESDAELVLTLMQEHWDDIGEHLESFIIQFPNLAKNIYRFCLSIPDKTELAKIVHSVLDEKNRLGEFQLFWLASLTEENLLKTKKAGDILLRLYEHDNATPVSRAKVLEIPETRFGMVDLREEQLKSGQSNWLSWAAAVGTMGQKKSQRNYVLTYAMKSSEMNRLIGQCVLAVP